jgi:hypothetical protein
VFGQAVTLTATVTAAGGGAATGTVTFQDGAATLGVAALDASGRAVLTVAGLGLGDHSITARYGGDADRAGGQSGVVSESVGPAGTRIILVPRAVLKRKRVVSVSLTAEVEPLAAGGSAPTGVVTFLVGKKRLGTAALIGGQATLSFKPGKVLNKSITITYGGADSFRSVSIPSPRLTARSLIAMARG